MGVRKLLDGAFPVLRTAVDFGEYHQELAGNSIEVWVNPSEDFRLRWLELTEAVKRQAKVAPKDPIPEKLQQKRAELYAELWGIPAEDVAALFASDGAGGLTAWLERRTWDLIGEYGAGGVASG